jgi:spore maturation protein A
MRPSSSTLRTIPVDFILYVSFSITIVNRPIRIIEGSYQFVNSLSIFSYFFVFLSISLANWNIILALSMEECGMISVIWTCILLISVVYGSFLGNMAAVSAAAMEGASNAVTVVLSLAGPMCLWCGVGELLRRSGLRAKLSLLLGAVLRRLFPKLSEDPDGFSALSANVTANLLGLGNAATPMGIAACQAMNDGTGTATDEQCRLVVLNTASIQLLPTTVAALRSGLGSESPLDILPAVLLTSLCAVSVGLLAAYLLEGKHGH